VGDFARAIPLLAAYDIASGYAIRKAVTRGRVAQSAIYNALIALFFGVRIRDINCSMKIYARRVMPAVMPKSASAFIDAEMLIRAARAGYRIAQFPVTHHPRLSGLASGSRPSVIFGTIRDMIAFRLGLL
jgi:hypothetical protein